MATTTTNFGWDIPQSTDLVKDGATAIAALGQDIDTALVDLKGGTTGQVLAKASGSDLDFSWVAQDDSNAIQNSIVDAKGDLIGATANDTPARLAVGTNGQVLVADSTAATGLAWSTVSSGGMTLIGTPTTLSGSSTVSITGIPATYTDLVIDFFGVTNASNTDYNINPNGNAGITDVVRGGTTLQQLNDGQLRILNNIAGPLASSTDNSCRLIIANYAATTAGGKPFDLWGGFIGSDSSKQINHVRGRIKTTSAITQLDFVAGSNWTAGTVKIYGVK
jgi:hypothetical protein